MKKFKYKFTKVMLVFIILGIALSVVALALNTYFVCTSGTIKTASKPVYEVIKYVAMYVAAILLLTILISLLVSSYYGIDDKNFKSCFGIIISKYDIHKIESIVLDRTTNKLSVYFDNISFIVISLAPDWYEDFINTLLEANPKIEYSIKSKESDNKDDDKKA